MKNSGKKLIIFEEVVIILCLFIGYQPHICLKNLIIVQKVSFLYIDRFDLLNFSKTKQITKNKTKSYYISCQKKIHQKLYINVIVTPILCLKIA